MEITVGRCADLCKLTRIGTGLGTFDLPGLFSHNYGQYARQATRGPRLPFNKCEPGLMWLSTPVQEGSSPAPLVLRFANMMTYFAVRQAHRPEQAEGLGTYEVFAHSALSPEGISSSLDFPRDDPEPVEGSSPNR